MVVDFIVVVSSTLGVTSSVVVSYLIAVVDFVVSVVLGASVTLSQRHLLGVVRI